MIYICIILTIISCLLLWKAKSIKNDRQEKIHETQIELILLQSQKKELQTLKEKELQTLNKVLQQITKKRKEQQEQSERILKNNENYYKELQKQYEKGYFNYVKTLDKAYNEKQQQFKSREKQLNKSLTQIQAELTAAAAAKRQEEEKSKNLDFYRIQISEKQKRDIQLLDTWKSQLFDPSFVSKVIWSSCIIKPTGDLCNRLTQGKTVCGIYKITSLVSSKCYIGQSVDIASRFKQHIKCGLGIDAPATNKLYNLMQQEKVYNFTFEILEKCSKDKLNERERFWIQTFQSDKFGLNGTGGNKK